MLSLACYLTVVVVAEKGHFANHWWLWQWLAGQFTAASSCTHVFQWCAL